jgi:(S)-ureidoglycine aminohydrolase
MTPNLLFGTTRTLVGPRHALIASDGHVVSSIPGVTGAATIVLISPEMGAGFTELTIKFAEGGYAEFPDSQIEAFLYVGQGSVTGQAKTEKRRLAIGEFMFVPAVTAWSLIDPEPGTEVHLFLKKYVALPGVPEPGVIFGREQEVAGQPFLGDEAALLQILLPDHPSFDLAVNIFNYQPGAHLPFVETHIMEHGLLMLAGTGVYRLEDNWYPVTAGDCIWMAPYCPQWFVAMGKTPARYLYYKDVNRLPAFRGSP